MTKLTKITIVLVILLSSTTVAIAQWGKKIQGDGNITTKTVNTADYDRVNIVGFMDVVLERGTEGAIQVTTDNNLHEYVEIESAGGTLKINIKNNVNLKTKKGIHITVPFESLSEVSLVGSGDVVGKDTINSEAFEVSVTGSGDLSLEVEAMRLDAKVTGSGDMVLNGKAQEFEVKVSGSGDFEGKSLKAENVQVYVSGSGDAEVHAKSNLKARVNGSGDIRYGGDPSNTDTKVLGSGTIKSM